MGRDPNMGHQGFMNESLTQAGPSVQFIFYS